MSSLYVRVFLNGAVADQRLCSVGDEVWLGSAPDAVMAFPGPSIHVRRFGPRLQVQGRWLDPGKPMRLRRGELEVHLEAVQEARSSRDWSLPMPDLRVLVASAAVVLLGAWWEAVGDFMERHPEAVAALTGHEAVVVRASPAGPEALSARVHEAEAPQGAADDTATVDTAAEEPGPTTYPVGFIEGRP